MMIVNEVAKQIEHRFEAQMGHVRRLHALGCKMVDEGNAAAACGDISNRLAVSMLARGTTAMHAVELLFSAGLETDAMSALRIIAELAIDFKWIWVADRESRIRLFVEYANIVNYRKLTRWLSPPNMALAEKLFEQFDNPHRSPDVDTVEKYLESIKAGYQRVCDDYDEYRSWAPISIYRRAREVDLTDLYDLAFVLGSEATHSGVATLAGQYVIHNGVGLVVCKPVVPTTAWALAVASEAYARLIEAVADHFGLADLQIEIRAVCSESSTIFSTVEVR